MCGEVPGDALMVKKKEGVCVQGCWESVWGVWDGGAPVTGLAGLFSKR